MGPTLDRVDVVGEGVHVLRVSLVPLQCDLDLDAVARALQVDDVGMDGRLRLVQMLDERDDAALVHELVGFLISLILDGDVDSAVEEGELAKALREDVEAEGSRLEDEWVRLERDLGAALARDAGLLDRRFRCAPVVALEVHLPAPPHLHLERLGEGVHDRDADAVEATRDLVGSLVELPARMELGHDDLGRRDALAGMKLNRNPSAIVVDGNARIDVNGDSDALALARKTLVDGVVDDLEDEVVKASLRGVADVHPGALPYGFEALEDPDVLGAVKGFWCAHEPPKSSFVSAPYFSFFGAATP